MALVGFTTGGTHRTFRRVRRAIHLTGEGNSTRSISEADPWCPSAPGDENGRLVASKLGHMNTPWVVVQDEIEACRRCEQLRVPYLRVPAGSKRHPPLPPPTPTKLLFVSVAPPWGGDYFWDETRPDSVRSGLFEALAPDRECIATCRDFWSAHYYLVAGVKCPSARGSRDQRPAQRARAECASHLRRELEAVRPSEFLRLDKVQCVAWHWRQGCDHQRPCEATVAQDLGGLVLAAARSR
jgi:uracil-DNA glycosylase